METKEGRNRKRRKRRNPTNFKKQQEDARVKVIINDRKEKARLIIRISSLAVGLILWFITKEIKYLWILFIIDVVLEILANIFIPKLTHKEVDHAHIKTPSQMRHKEQAVVLKMDRKKKRRKRAAEIKNEIVDTITTPREFNNRSEQEQVYRSEFDRDIIETQKKIERTKKLLALKQEQQQTIYERLLTEEELRELESQSRMDQSTFKKTEGEKMASADTIVEVDSSNKPEVPEPSSPIPDMKSTMVEVTPVDVEDENEAGINTENTIHIESLNERVSAKDLEAIVKDDIELDAVMTINEVIDKIVHIDTGEIVYEPKHTITGRNKITVSTKPQRFILNEILTSDATLTITLRSTDNSNDKIAIDYKDWITNEVASDVSEVEETVSTFDNSDEQANNLTDDPFASFDMGSIPSLDESTPDADATEEKIIEEPTGTDTQQSSSQITTKETTEEKVNQAATEPKSDPAEEIKEEPKTKAVKKPSVSQTHSPDYLKNKMKRMELRGEARETEFNAGSQNALEITASSRIFPYEALENFTEEDLLDVLTRVYDTNHQEEIPLENIAVKVKSEIPNLINKGKTGVPFVDEATGEVSFYVYKIRLKYPLPTDSTKERTFTVTYIFDESKD